MFTEEQQQEVDRLVRAAMTESIEGFREWFKNETDIIDKTTKEVLTNAEINIRPNTKSIMDCYVYPRLKKHGIEFYND